MKMLSSICVHFQIYIQQAHALWMRVGPFRLRHHHCDKPSYLHPGPFTPYPLQATPKHVRGCQTGVQELALHHRGWALFLLTFDLSMLELDEYQLTGAAAAKIKVKGHYLVVRVELTGCV